MFVYTLRRLIQFVPTLILVSIAIFALQVKTASLFPVATDLYPARDVATVWGLSGAAGSFGAALFQWLFGWLIDEFSYYPVFVIVSLMCLAQALLVTLFVRHIAPLPELVAEKERLKAARPSTKADRRAWFRKLQELTRQMRPALSDQAAAAARELSRTRSELAANRILMSREFAWPLFPEGMLRDYFTRLG